MLPNLAFCLFVAMAAGRTTRAASAAIEAPATTLVYSCCQITLVACSVYVFVFVSSLRAIVGGGVVVAVAVADFFLHVVNKVK